MNYKQEIEEKLASDLHACDFQWSLFYCALSSYRHNTVLRPLPPSFQANENDNANTDISVLRNISDQIPPLNKLKDESLSKDNLDLLHWVLNSNNNFTLTSVSKSYFAEIKRKTGQLLPTAEPTHIFRVVYNDLANARYSALQESKQTFYAYHGSRLENFYSILHNGIHKRMNKNSLFGEGTYLSSELGVCMNYSPTGQGWPKSIIGDRLGCTAVCQLIDHPEVKCQLRDVSNKCDPSRARSRESVGGDIPEKYFLVQNDDLIRVKYILVYAETTNNPETVRSNLVWFSRHRFAIIMLGYFVMLMAVGIFNSRSAKLYLNKFSFT